MIGTKLGHYEITSHLGSGGMGDVYQATDTKLGRSVAVKLLPAAFARDAERVARFEREARVLASLNHPNIATIYGVEESGEWKFLIMELVQGETLARSIKTPLALDTALNYARQIADALEAAHEKGIIHRDLKPANIMITQQGTVKVLDFGLAALPGLNATSDPSNSPTLTISPTAAGMILGTAAYMSPEQASGKPADKRADIWSFGVVLWEMLAGKQLFRGETVSHILASVLKDEPDLTRVPPKVRRLLRRCLEKDPQKRLRDIGDAMELVEETPAAPARGAKMPWIIATAVMALIAAVSFWSWLKPQPAARPSVLTHFVAATPQGLATNPVVISPDGSRIAYVGVRGNQIFLRAMDNPEAKPVPGTEGGSFPSFSPDGQWLAFYAAVPPEQELRKVPVSGGPAQTLATHLTRAVPMSWETDGTILLGGDDLRRLPETGGQAAVIAKLDPAAGEVLLVSPKLLPGGKYILATVVTPKGVSALRIVAIDAQTGQKKTLLEGVGEARLALTGARDSGHLFWNSLGALVAAPFNVKTLDVGPSVPVLEGVRSQGGLTGAGVSQTGTLVYLTTGSGIPAQTLMWVNRDGTEQPLPAPPRNYATPEISPDGTRVAFTITDFSPTVSIQVWVYDFTRGALTRMTFENSNGVPVWTRDGNRLIHLSGDFVGTKGTLMSVAADGSGQPVTLMGEGVAPTATSVSPDGKVVIGTRSAGGRNALVGADAWVLHLDVLKAEPKPFLDTRFTRGNFQFSPDGKWVAYQSDETGRNEIFVVAYPGPGGKSQVSIDGGTNPRWNRNGRELFFRNGARMMAVDVETGPAFRASTPKALFEKESAAYDVAPDGKRFLMLKLAPVDPSSQSELHVILNWFDELRRRVPLPKP